MTNSTDKELKPEFVKLYKKKAVQPMYKWQDGFCMEGISISEADVKKGSPKTGDMIAFNPENKSDSWLVEKDFFDKNYEPANTRPAPADGDLRIVSLLEEVIRLHADKDSDSYNGCDVPGEKCQWCEDAEQAIQVLQSKQGGDAAIRQVVREQAHMLNQYATPDPYDERDTSSSWLQEKMFEVRKVLLAALNGTGEDDA